MKSSQHFCLLLLISFSVGIVWAGTDVSAPAGALQEAREARPPARPSAIGVAPSGEDPGPVDLTSGATAAATLPPNASRGKAGVVVVARKGGDCSTIQAGLEAAQKLRPSDRNRVVVLVYPGVYEEEHLEVPDYVSLQGVSRDSCIIRKATVQLDRNRIHSLVAVAGNSTIADFTLENLQRKGGVSTALLLGYSFKIPGWVNGKTIHARDLTLTGEIRDVLVLVGDNEITVDNCSVLSKHDIDTVNVKPPKKRTRYLFRNCTIRSGQGAGLFITGPGFSVFESCRFLDDVDRGTMRFVADVPQWEGTTLSFYHCSFLNGKTYAPGRAVDEVTVGKGFRINMDQCVYRTLGYHNPKRLFVQQENTGDVPMTVSGPLTLAAGGESLKPLNAKGGISVGKTTVLDPHGFLRVESAKPAEAPENSFFANSADGGRLTFKDSNGALHPLYQ